MFNGAIDTDTISNILYASSIATRIRSFQFRHRIMDINAKLHKWGIKANNISDLCDEYEENYVHLFCEGRKVVAFWDGMKRWIVNNYMEKSHKIAIVVTTIVTRRIIKV